MTLPRYREWGTAENGVAFLEFALASPVSLGDDHLLIKPGSVGQPRDGDPTAS